MPNSKKMVFEFAVIGVLLVLMPVMLVNNNSVPANSTIKLEEGIPAEFQGKLKIFILAGQSNMSGEGEITAANRGGDNSRIYVFGNDYRWRIAAEPIDDPAGQVDLISKDEKAGFGPGRPFATALLDADPDAVIGLVPCAKGDSTIEEWQRDMSDKTLYGSCLKRAIEASRMGEITGVLFLQGESDALDPQKTAKGRVLSPHGWGEKFAAFVDDLRNDLQSPELPVIFAQIGIRGVPNSYLINGDAVKREQADVSIPFCAMITTIDLETRDGVHFTNDSYQVIGERFAGAFLNLTGLSDR